jgi:hypothetical protein
MATFHFGQLQGRISKAFQAEVFNLHIDARIPDLLTMFNNRLLP